MLIFIVELLNRYALEVCCGEEAASAEQLPGETGWLRGERKPRVNHFAARLSKEGGSDVTEGRIAV